MGYRGRGLGERYRGEEECPLGFEIVSSNVSIFAFTLHFTAPRPSQTHGAQPSRPARADQRFCRHFLLFRPITGAPFLKGGCICNFVCKHRQHYNKGHWKSLDSTTLIVELSHQTQFMHSVYLCRTWRPSRQLQSAGITISSATLIC